MRKVIDRFIWITLPTQEASAPHKAIGNGNIGFKYKKNTVHVSNLEKLFYIYQYFNNKRELFQALFILYQNNIIMLNSFIQI